MSTFRPFGPRSSAHHFERALFSSAHAAALGDVHPKGAQGVLQELYPDDFKAAALLLRGAVDPADTSTTATLAVTAVGDFFSSLTQSAAAKLIDAGKKASLAGVASVAYPRRAGAPTGDVPWVREGGAFSVRQFNLDTVTIGPARKLGIITTMTREVAAHQATFETLIREDVTATLDAALFSDVAADDTRPAGLLFGLTAETASAATSPSDRMLEDLETLAGAIIGAGGVDVVFIASPRQALSAKLRLSNTRATVWSSAALPDGMVIAVEAESFVSAFGVNPRITSSIQATVHMDTAAAALSTHGTPNTVSAPSRNMFQTDCVALKCVLDAAWVMRADNRVAFIDAATWGAAAP